MSRTAQPAPSAVDTSRPFGAHLRMSWWKPFVLFLALPLVLVVLQVLAYQLVGVIEGSDDPLSPELTPLKSLAVNLATGATGLVAVLLLVWMTRVPRPRRPRPARSRGGRGDGRSVAAPTQGSTPRKVTSGPYIGP
ncbi:hypothetical protein ACQPWY_14610 [Pseudonocardia xinjiangensis]|uniref:hypothetical protein n=1 Tax=Pseudonocardia xinjiangensis TaxID=75289 RepID=UPI003D8D9ACA